MRARTRMGTVKMAERVGFEPTVLVRVQQISSLSRSTTLAPLHILNLTRPPSLASYRDLRNRGYCCVIPEITMRLSGIKSTRHTGVGRHPVDDYWTPAFAGVTARNGALCSQ